MKDHPIEVLVADGKHEVLEGDPIEGMVIVKFPSVKAAKDRIYSEAYAANCMSPAISVTTDCVSERRPRDSEISAEWSLSRSALQISTIETALCLSCAERQGGRIMWPRPGS
jgi:hypothetical protein